MNILLAEDDKQLGSLLSTMLRRADFKATWVESGDIAHKQVYCDDYDDEYNRDALINLESIIYNLGYFIAAKKR